MGRLVRESIDPAAVSVPGVGGPRTERLQMTARIGLRRRVD
jgi:hypothetical protein